MAAVPAPSECPTHTCQRLESSLKGLVHEIDLAFDKLFLGLNRGRGFFNFWLPQ